MNSTSEHNTQPSPMAYLIIAIGGGVVGQDYAKWLDVEPFMGMALGAIVSMVLTRALLELARDPEGKVHEFCTSVGVLTGVAIGGIASTNVGEGFVVWCVGAVIGAVVGFGLGQIAAAVVSMMALSLLLLSQGPLGVVVRGVLMN